MTLQDRLRGICEMATGDYEENGQVRPIWRVGTAGQLGIVAAPEHCAAAILYAGSSQVYLIWYDSGKIEVRVALSEGEVVPGAVTHMTILAAANPEGDFQVAESLEAIL